MKLLLDEGLPRSAAAYLDDHGIAALHVGDLGMSEAEDEKILQRAREYSEVVVTLDADFHSLLALTAARNPSVIRIRIEGLRGPPLAELLQDIVSRFDEDLEQGSLITVQPGRVRIRRLPLIRPSNEL